MLALVLDFESTGVDVLNDRIVQGFLGLMGSQGNFERQQEWLVDPGVPIPEGAAAVHGFRNTPALSYTPNATPASLIEEIHAIIQAECAEGGAPLVIYNASYDLSLLESERRRHAPHVVPIDFRRVKVVDPLVLWKRIDRYRKGGRKLEDAAGAFGVPFDAAQAHGADYDCLITGRVALRMLQHDLLCLMPFDVIHEATALWAGDQRASLADYFRKKGEHEKADGVDVGWPWHSALERKEAQVAA